MSTSESSTFELELRYKGGRSYLHGTDLFDALLEHTGASGPVSLRLYAPLLHPLRFRVLDAGETLKERAAIFVWQQDGVERVGAVTELKDKVVEGRYPYDEAMVLRDATFDCNEAQLGSCGEYSFVEKAVALHKAMLNGIRGKTVDWWFSRIDLTEVPASNAAIKLRLASKPGGRLVRSRIIVDEEDIGSIYFSEKTQ